MIKSDIIIPTFNRPVYLKRILSYFNYYKVKSKCIIADSSLKENQKKNMEIISMFSNLDIDYLKPYPSDMNMFYKINDALNFSSEKFCVICADDDFIVPLSIDKCVEFLNKNSDYTIAHGNYLSFYLSNNLQNKQFNWLNIPNANSITSADPKDRFLFHLSNYSKLPPTFYAVHKTDFLKMIFKETVKYTDPENDGQFGELLPSMLTSIYGKIKILDILYCARESIPISAGRTSKKLHDFVSEGTYNKKYNRFKECLANHLSKKSDIDLKDAKKIVDLGWKEYTRKYKGFLIPKLNYIAKSFPIANNFEKTSKKILRKINNKKKLSGIKNEFIVKTPSKNIEEFEIIKKFVIDYSN